MAEKTVEDYMVTWGLQEYIQTFKEQKIDTNGLYLLTDDNIRALIPFIGHQNILRAQLETLRSINNASQRSPGKFYLAEQHDPEASTSRIENYVVSDLQCVRTPPLGSTLAYESYDIDNIISTPSLLLGKNELYNLLNSSNEGKALLTQYEKSGLLNNIARRKLCNIIVGNELKTDPNRMITSPRLHELACQIKEIFKKENTSTYFIPFASFGPFSREAAKGKLLDTFRHRRREFMKSGIIPCNRKRVNSENSSLSDASGPSSPAPCKVRAAIHKLVDASEESDVEEALLWLRNSTDPWFTVDLYWNQTSKSRLSSLSTTSKTIGQYFDEFKALRQQKGVYLLLKDFCTLFPDYDSALFNNLPLYRSKIIEHARKRQEPFVKEILSYIEEEDEELLNTAAFVLLPYLMNPSTVKTGKGKRNWRPSKVEILESFITHIKSPAELEESITRRREKLASLGLTLQPYIVIEGPSLKEISARYIIIDNSRYRNNDLVQYHLTSIVQVVDACFKIIFALNAEYPAECASVWYFIQKSFYKLTTNSDKMYTTATALLTDLSMDE